MKIIEKEQVFQGLKEFQVESDHYRVIKSGFTFHVYKRTQSGHSFIHCFVTSSRKSYMSALEEYLDPELSENDEAYYNEY